MPAHGTAASEGSGMLDFEPKLDRQLECNKCARGGQGCTGVIKEDTLPGGQAPPSSFKAAATL